MYNTTVYMLMKQDETHFPSIGTLIIHLKMVIKCQTLILNK